MDQNNVSQLNDYIYWVIKENGTDYVVENYIDLRDQYYYMKAS